MRRSVESSREGSLANNWCGTRASTLVSKQPCRAAREASSSRSSRRRSRCTSWTKTYVRRTPADQDIAFKKKQKEEAAAKKAAIEKLKGKK